MFSGSRYQFFRALSHVTAISQSSSWARLIHPAIAHLLIYAILTWKSEFDDIWWRDGDGEMVIVRWWWWNQMASSPCIWFNTCFVHQASLTNPLVHLVPGYRFKAKPTHLSENLPSRPRRCFSSSSPPWFWSYSPSGDSRGGQSFGFWQTMDTMWDKFSHKLFFTYMKNQGASNQLHIWEHPPDCQGRPWHNAWLARKVRQWPMRECENIQHHFFRYGQPVGERGGKVGSFGWLSWFTFPVSMWWLVG